MLIEARNDPGRRSDLSMSDIRRALAGAFDGEILDALRYYQKRGLVRRIKSDSKPGSRGCIPGLSDQMSDRWEWIGEDN